MAFEGLELPGFLEFDIDSLVDDSLINTCTLFDEINSSSDVQMQKNEKSPFHESDSGVSEIDGNGSPLPFGENDEVPMLDEMLDNPVGPFLFGNDESDEENIYQNKQVLSYVHDGVRSSGQTGSVPKDVIDSQNCQRKTRSQTAFSGKNQNSQLNSLEAVAQSHSSKSVKANISSKNQAPKKQSCDSQSEDEIDMESTSKCRRKGSLRVKRPGERLPSSSSDKCSVTSVKVLRIVQSGSDGNAEEDIAKALEERNRKNAEMARQNRLKKKEYVGNLEREVEDGRKIIDKLESALNDAEEERDSYKKEVEYLKSVLANQSALAGLLKNIPSVSGVSLSSSVSRKRVAELDHCYTPRKKSCLEHPTSSQPAGVCLHVDGSNASLEFCHHCASMAKGGPLS